MTAPCPRCNQEIKLLLDEYAGEWIGRCKCGEFVTKKVKEVICEPHDS